LVATDLSDTSQLAEAFRGSDAVAHCAGINREIGSQTYRCVHIQGTENVVAAARKAGVKKTVLISFLQARPHCGSPYHESKWAAEEIVRESGMTASFSSRAWSLGGEITCLIILAIPFSRFLFCLPSDYDRN